MAATLVEFLALVASLTTFRFVDAPLVAVPFQGATLQTTGYSTCDGTGRPTITLAARADRLDATLVHELAHARDCLDNGLIDGSLLPADAVLERPISHCTANRAEMYACWVTEQAGHRSDATIAAVEDTARPTGVSVPPAATSTATQDAHAPHEDESN